MNRKKILLSLFLVSVLSLSPAYADFDYADSAEFPLDLLSFPLGGAYDYSDSSQFGLDLYPVNRGWADSNSFRGVTTELVVVITHGYRLNGNLPNWPLTMAQAIRVRAGGGKVMLYNKATGIFEVQQPSDNYGIKVLVFDWADESNQDHYGHSEAAGDALFASLIMGQQRGNFALESLHFIGHSRGCVVNSEAIERLIAASYSINQMTMLDAVDAGWWQSFFCDDYDVNPSLGNIGFVSWIGIDWADNYWSDDGGLDGRDLPGTYPTYLGNSINHSEVHEWYLGTIDLVSGEEEWYGGTFPTREEGGYYYSQIVGGSRQAVSGEQMPIAFTFESDGIVNGNFNRGPMWPNSLPFPGWESHEGGGPGHFDSQYLELDLGNEWRRHNRFYVPEDAVRLSFYYDVTTATSTDDELVVYIGEEVSGNILGTVPLNSEQAGFETFTIPFEKRGTVQTITFKIDSAGSVDSQIRIDDVQIGLCDTLWRADFDCSYNVDYVDLAYLTQRWLTEVWLGSNQGNKWGGCRYITIPADVRGKSNN